MRSAKSVIKTVGTYCVLGSEDWAIWYRYEDMPTLPESVCREILLNNCTDRIISDRNRDIIFRETIGDKERWYIFDRVLVNIYYLGNIYYVEFNGRLENKKIIISTDTVYSVYYKVSLGCRTIYKQLCYDKGFHKD